MKLLDISWPLSPETTEYKNKNTIKFEKTKNFDEHNVRDSVITMGSHTGTHVDAPSHFVEKGESIENVPLDALCGAARVLDCTKIEECITATDLESHLINAGDIILLKTKNSSLPATGPFEPNFVYLEKSGASYLATKNVKAVGIDYLGIERNQPNHETHTALLGCNIPIIEGLRLEDIEPGLYGLVCLPLAIVGLEAAPASAVLIEN